ncbi:MAG: T9SS type A sorting domain-containing protein [Ignavibacteriaceae bacterium]|nr:T9SS type A sorting domain-containing protein [Ignavibacteriaceae bacterium]
MRKFIVLFSVVLFLMGIIPSTPLYAQSDFVRGVYLFDGTSVDFSQMASGLHLNWVQGTGEKDDGTKTTSLLQNNVNLNVMGIMKKDIYYKSAGQRMVFEAEQSSDAIKNYFATRSGAPDNNDNTLWKVTQGTNSAGYMVQGCTPNYEYNFKQTHYTASFILKRGTVTSGNPLVARLEAWCVSTNTLLASQDLYYNDLSTSLTTKALGFYTSSSSTSLKVVGILTGTSASTSTACNSIDVRVYWYGNVTTWLDKVIIQDDTGQQLFAGTNDAAITSSISGFTGYPLLKRFYLSDEPVYSQFLSYSYVKNLISTTYPGTSAITVLYDGFARFISDTQPQELLVDCYPINAGISTPAMTNTEASDVGITSYTTDAVYTGQLQNALGKLTSTLGIASVAAQQSGKSLWYTPQLHGEYFVTTGKFQKPNGNLSCRPPTGNEIKAMSNLGISYGAKGIVAYPYGNDQALWDEGTGWSSLAYFAGLVSSVADADGIYRTHSTNYGTFPTSTGTKSIRVGYQEKWDAVASIMGYYANISSTLSSLSWLGTKSWGSGTTVGTWSGLISSVTSATTASTPVTDAATYVETGVFSYNNLDYIFVVNRRTLSTDQRNITVTINKSTSTYNNWKVTEVGTSNTWTASKTGPFKTTFQPGEGKLFRLEPVMLAGGTIAYDETVPSNSTLTVAGNITVNQGVTLTIQSGTNLNIANGDSIFVNGILSALGTVNSYVNFNPSGTSKWGGIIFNGTGSANASINYVNINNCKIVKFTNSSSASIENSTINNSVQGVYIYNSYPYIYNTQIIDPQQNGIYIDASGFAPLIENNTIKKNSTNSTYYNYQGIYVVDNSTPQILHNKIGGFCYGIYVGSSTASFENITYANQNNLLNNNVDGIAAGWGSTVIAGYQGAGYYNSIYGNTNYDAYCYQSSHLYAEYDYWGTSSHKYVDGTSTLDYANVLTNDPWGGQTPSIKQKNNSYSSDALASVVIANPSVTDSNSTNIFSGLNLEVKGDINGATTNFISMISKDSHSNFALTELFKIMKKYSRSDILDYFGSFSSNNKNYPLVSKLIADNNLQTGQFNKAINTYDYFIKTYPNDYYGINARFQELFAYLHVKGDKVTAQQILSDIKALNLSATDPQWFPQIQMAEYLLSSPGISVDQEQAGQFSKDKELENTITDFALFNNYPNPFNPTTLIEYQIPKDGYVSLKVYDVLGRLVRTLVDGYKTVGKYSVSFDASKLASGIYIYELKSSNFSSIKKMILTK